MLRCKVRRRGRVVYVDPVVSVPGLLVRPLLVVAEWVGRKAWQEGYGRLEPLARLLSFVFANTYGRTRWLEEDLRAACELFDLLDRLDERPSLTTKIVVRERLGGG